MAEPKPKNLQEAIAAAKKKDKKLILGKLSEANQVPQGLTTGNIALDTLTGIGGYPMGRVTEQFGPPSSGKTTAALQAAARFQGIGGKIIYADFEGTLDETYCQALGLKTDDESFIYMQPDFFEQGANLARDFMSYGEVGMIIFDSVATMVTESEAAAETGKAMVADRAKMMAQFLRQTRSLYKQHNIAAIFLNHLMQLLDTTGMGQKLAAAGVQRDTTPGGTALPFYASLRIKFKQVGSIRSKETLLLSGKKEDVIKQHKVQATVVKNKVGDPFGQAELRVRHGKGFSNEFSVFQILADYGAIIRTDPKAGKYEFPEDLQFDGMAKNYIIGENAVVQTMEDKPDWTERLALAAAKILEENGPKKVDGNEYDENGMTEEELAEIKAELSALTSDEADEILAAATES